MPIKYCPACGSDEIRRVRRDWTGGFGRETFVVRDLEFYQCPSCWERVLDRDARRRIDFERSRVLKRIA